MSESHQVPNDQIKTRSYVIGLLLSLAFTIIPYYAVVNKVISGTALLVTILGIAVLQMIIQIVFFLHLGRGPKPFYNIIFFAFTVITILVVVGGSIWIMNHLNYNMASTDVAKYLAEKESIYQVDGTKTGACQKIRTNHQITITGGQVNPIHTTASLCDTLTFVNQDDTVHDMAFGAHLLHKAYAGETELTLRKGRNKTITLNQAGTYQFHDHLNPSITGLFTVNP